MILLGGGMGLAGWFVFGRLAERIGRRWVGVMSFLGLGLAVIVFYQSTAIFFAFILLVFMEAGALLTGNTLGTELFPTRMRSTAKTWISSAALVGATTGMLTVGLLSERLGGMQVVITMLGALPILASPLALLVPEPRGRDLEDIASCSAPRSSSSAAASSG
jgi:predicted MFS family arabinose efflux permease